MLEKTIELQNIREAQALFGQADENLKAVGDEFGVKVFSRDSRLILKGPAVSIKKAEQLLQYLLEAIRGGQDEIGRKDLYYIMRGFKSEESDNKSPRHSAHQHYAISKQVGPKTKGQREYVEAIREYDIVFGIGPAGTGKTYLAMAMAVEALKNSEVRRLILTRPAIEAGESLGFLPGDMYDKVSPYLRPLYDALYDMMEGERIEKYLEVGTIEVAPLAYMRGRTLNDAFIILDEAQNCTAEQMKMFLTRLGFDSKVVITGDITQSDLPGGRPIGLLQAQEVLKDIDGIKFAYFTGSDVVRHELVQRIIEAYDKTGNSK
ncbi:MAG: PhoH family protein [Candidatus Omnitrophota bacterium]